MLRDICVAATAPPDPSVYPGAWGPRAISIVLRNANLGQNVMEQVLCLHMHLLSASQLG